MTIHDEKMVTIELYGQLGKLFGKSHKRVVRTNSEAIHVKQ